MNIHASRNRGIRVFMMSVVFLVAACGGDGGARLHAAVNDGAAVAEGGGAIAADSSGAANAGHIADRDACPPSGETDPPLTDAVLEFMTYLGGSGYDQARDVAVDAEGNAYVVGGTRSRDFPATTNLVRAGASESSSIHDYDVFVVKYDPAGNVVWSTLLGGPNYDRAYGVEVDASGNVYIGGRAGAGFPVTTGAVQTTFMGGQEAAHYGGQDGFVAKLSSDGSRILWATYFGTSDFRIIRDIDIDASGNVYVGTGYNSPPPAWRSWLSGTPRSTPPGWNSWFGGAIQDTPGGGNDAIVAKIRADGAQVLWATYLGGSSDDSFHTGSEPSVRVDSAGNVVVAFGAGPGLPTTAGAHDRTFNGGSADVYVAKIRADGGKLLFGTYVGTDKEDNPQGVHSLALDSMDRVYVVGFTQSPGFSTTPSALLRSPSGNGHVYAFAVQLSADGGELLASTYLHSWAAGEGIDVDACGNVYMTARFTTPGFPATPDAEQSMLIGGSDGAIIKLSPDLSTILYATLLGGNSSNKNDAFRGVAVTPGGAVVAIGTAAPGWPLHNAYQEIFGGNGDVPVVRIQTGRQLRSN